MWSVIIKKYSGVPFEIGVFQPLFFGRTKNLIQNGRPEYRKTPQTQQFKQDEETEDYPAGKGTG